MFQSTHPLGVRLSSICYASGYTKVSIHAPTRGATQFTSVQQSTLQVSIHAPTRGATCCPLSVAPSVARFNPRTHSGCDDDDCYQFVLNSVSIHAPTRGATKEWQKDKGFPRCFNPRTHSGCDSRVEPASNLYQVSIHAPTRGATESELILNGGEMFQSTHPLGVRLKRYRQLTPFCLFQSTHPLGVRRRVEFSMNSEGRFNPRTHSGCDFMMKDVNSSFKVSIHAPTRGATMVRSIPN